MTGLRAILAGLGAAAAVALPGVAQASPAPACPYGAVCLWSGPNYTGASYVWTPNQGNVFLGDRAAALVDHVGSFIANTRACLIDTGDDPGGDFHGARLAGAGDYRADYLGAFGGVMDRIASGAYC
ncbi:peptidase inhibitor family I36 protein [Rhizohabitans arisaemae]|uniref:peptidase inhibitor family I36 protein n=1 Tax=Rhizohabitans arisaemae TaxID=2720610 RepID=UPI0024B0D9A5|nr:peptidase inhibitor family I36 protein [Rhizohabitans arisaemae]